MQGVQKNMKVIGNIYTTILQTTCCEVTIKKNYSSNFIDVTVYNKLTNQSFNDKYLFIQSSNTQQGFLNNLPNKSSTKTKKIGFTNIYDDFKKLCQQKQLQNPQKQYKYDFGHVISHQNFNITIFQDGQIQMQWKIINSQEKQQIKFKLAKQKFNNDSIEEIILKAKKKQIDYQNEIARLKEQLSNIKEEKDGFEIVNKQLCLMISEKTSKGEIKTENTRVQTEMQILVQKEKKTEGTTLIKTKMQIDTIQPVKTIQKQSQTLPITIIDDFTIWKEKTKAEIIKKEESQHKNPQKNERKSFSQNLLGQIKQKQGMEQQKIIQLLNSSLDQINCNPFHPRDLQLGQFTFQNREITKKKGEGYCQLLLQPLIETVGVFLFQFQVRRQLHASILIGIIDDNQQKNQSSRSSENAVGYSGNGYLYPEKKKIGSGFKEHSIVQTIVNRRKGTIKWIVNGVTEAQTHKQFIQQRDRKIVPYIQMGSLNNCLKWYGCRYEMESK